MKWFQAFYVDGKVVICTNFSGGSIILLYNCSNKWPTFVTGFHFWFIIIFLKMTSSDKDFRFMATNDLMAELQKDSIKLDDDSERKVSPFNCMCNLNLNFIQ